VSLAPAHALALAAALLVDRLAGDPPSLWSRAPHPAALIGKLIDMLDAKLNDPLQSFSRRRRRGVAAILAVAALAGTAGVFLELAFSALPFSLLLNAIAASALIAQKSLVDHVQRVADRLASEGLEGGRDAVALIVGRDISVLDEGGVSRAAIESAAENFSDGVVAPALWYVLLGLPGLIVYKAVNTADSMIGNRSPRHDAFGWAAARLDDLLNLVPARLSALLIAAAAVFVRGDMRRAGRIAWRDARLHKSPNAGWPEAAAAGALGLALGGPRRYGAIEVDGAWLNPEGRSNAGATDIRRAIRLIDAAWAILFGLACLTALLIAL
jgi:adenosylcobinamide-phosphate synthase